MDNEKMVEAVIKAQGNDLNAFAELYLGYKDGAYYVAKKMFSDENKALNIVYETCISVFRQVKTLNPASAFQLWVNMIAGSVCKRRLSKEEQGMFMPGSSDSAPLGFNEDANAQISRAAFDNEATKSMICSIADALPIDQKLCALLYYFCGLKVEYIAQALGSTPVAVKNRIFSATNKIKEGMYGYESNGEKLYAVPAWLIASSFVLQAKTMVMNPSMTQQVFAAATQAVSGKAITPPVIAQYVQSMQEQPVKQTAPVAEPQQELSASEPSAKPAEEAQASASKAGAAYESIDLGKIKERDYDRFENADDEEDEPRKSKKQKTGGKKKGGLIALIIVLVVLVLAAAAVFVLPKVTDGKIDPISMVTSLFSSPEKQMEKADTLMSEGDYEGAIQILEKLAEKDASNKDLYSKLITCYEQTGITEKAIDAYKNYFTLVPRQNDLALYQKYIALAQNEPIVWVDEQFGAMICAALGKDSVTPADLANISELYIVGNSKAYIDAQSYANDMESAFTFNTDATEKRVSYIYNGAEQTIYNYNTFVDLLNFGGLRTLSLDFVGYGDLETVLKLKTDISSLRFSGCQLGTIPDLTMLGSLSSLTITHDTISDISPLSTLTGLTSLDLSFNAISNLTPLSGLTGLTSLNLYSNAVEDIEPLATLTALTELNIGRNKIEDFDPISELEFEEDMYNDDDQFWEPEEVTE